MTDTPRADAAPADVPNPVAQLIRMFMDSAQAYAEEQAAADDSLDAAQVYSELMNDVYANFAEQLGGTIGLTCTDPLLALGDFLSVMTEAMSDGVQQMKALQEKDAAGALQ